jgi:NADPH:quinone reductase-like Zn-dependent oxidoreductase
MTAFVTSGNAVAAAARHPRQVDEGFTAAPEENTMPSATSPIADTMTAVLLTGHGGFDRLEVRDDVPVPRPGPGEVLIRVAAAGVNNTDINTRIGWYSKSVRGDTGAGAEGGLGVADEADGGWSGAPLAFPRIQGIDACGRVVQVGPGVDPARVGERVLVRPMQSPPEGDRPYHCWTLGSECDGAFAQYCVARSDETWAVDCDWSDVELGSLPCSYSTAEAMLARAGVGAERVLITGASGGVGSAAVQLAVRRGAEVVAVASPDKAPEVRALGAAVVVPRDGDLLAAPARESVDVVVDLVGGPHWPALLEVLRRGGRYVTSGAIAGPLVELDLRTLYLKDLSLLGSTWQPRHVFEDLVGYVERGEIRALVARTYPLADIVQAQRDFLAKRFTGKLVLVP